MNNFFVGFESELVKLSSEKQESAIAPLSIFGGTIGSLIGLLASSKGKRIAKALKGGGIGTLGGAGAGAVVDFMPGGDVIVDREALEKFRRHQEFSPRKWGKVWV